MPASRPNGAKLPVQLPPLLKPGQVAALCYVVASTVENWRKDGRLEAIPTPGGEWRYPTDQAALAAFVAQHARQAARQVVQPLRRTA